MTTLVRRFILATVLLLALLDVVLFAKHGVEATFSRILLRWAKDVPAVSFAAGFLCGHLFWPQRPRK